MYRWLTPLVLRTHECLSGQRYWSQAQELFSLQWHSPKALQDRCMAKLSRLLAHAYNHVPYYWHLFRQVGLHPHDIRSLDDLSRLPITTKRELRAQFPTQMVASNLPPERRRLQKTSGSTGMPLEFYTDRQAQDVWRASRYFFQALAGIKPSDSHLIITSPRPPTWGGREERLRRLLTGSATKYFSVFDLSLPRFTEALHGVSGYYLQGYPSYIARLARELEEQRVRLKSYPKAVFTDSETLTSLEAAQITHGFHCPVLVHYTSFEFQNMALSCPDNPGVMHVNTESILIEIVTEAGHTAAPGERGRVIITDLHNYVMPFVRYDIGDMAVAGDQCSCGRGLPTLTRLEGRTKESIRTPAGKLIHSGVLGTLLFVRQDFLSHVLEYQVIQTALNRVILKLVPSSLFTHETEAALLLSLSELFGPEMHVALDLVPHIPREANGKRLIIKTELETE